MSDTRRLTSRGPGWKGMEGMNRPIRRIRGNHHGRPKDAECPQKGRVANRLRQETLGELAPPTEKEKLFLAYCERIAGFSVSCALQEDGFLVLHSLGGQEILRN
jgi:hypothetical protein